MIPLVNVEHGGLATQRFFMCVVRATHVPSVEISVLAESVLYLSPVREILPELPGGGYSLSGEASGIFSLAGEAEI